MPFIPKRILMLKSHSAGIGDILRSSAAWRVLKNAYPGVELHLVFFSTEPGYPSEPLMRDHHLLSSFTVIDKRTRSFADWKRFLGELNAAAEKIKPDLVIDFETNGVRLAALSRWLSLKFRCQTVGISQFPGRGLLYSKSAPSRKKYAAQRGLPWPTDYVDRDFVALAALGLERNGTAIDLEETENGREFRKKFFEQYGINEGTPVLGINIGCATPGAEAKRTNYEILSELILALEKENAFQVVLTGARFEATVNQEFIKVHSRKSTARMIDLAGATDVSGLTGIIKTSRLFISSDSGPYHIAVAMRIPTLALFNFPNPQHYHKEPWVRCCMAESLGRIPELVAAAEQLLKH